MADENSHIAAANRNQKTLNQLCADIAAHSPWVVTVAAYKAIHEIEAAFAADPRVGHTCDHGERFRTLKTLREYKSIYKHFSPLYRASRVARYLESNGNTVSCFDEWLEPDKVASEVLFHRLKQIENGVRRKLNTPESLSSVDDVRPILETAKSK